MGHAVASATNVVYQPRVEALQTGAQNTVPFDNINSTFSVHQIWYHIEILNCDDDTFSFNAASGALQGRDYHVELKDCSMMCKHLNGTATNSIRRHHERYCMVRLLAEIKASSLLVLIVSGSIVSFFSEGSCSWLNSSSRTEVGLRLMNR